MGRALLGDQLANKMAQGVYSMLPKYVLTGMVNPQANYFQLSGSIPLEREESRLLEHKPAHFHTSFHLFLSP
jgi:hypothetical protein